MHLTTLSLAALLGSVTASPVDSRATASSADGQDNPVVKLPYGSYQSTYDKGSDAYIFKNVRFAAPPVGKLRFAKPAPPEKAEGIQNLKTSGIACPSIFPSKLLKGVLGAIPSAKGNLITPLAENMMADQEDCLFLDVIVPAKAFKEGAPKLPVLNWLYGGAYILGSKEFLFDGRPLVAASEGNLVYVSANYRLGALGWLAGTTLEKDSSGTPNAGLYDQRAVLEWIRDYIPLFGGNPQDVSVIGESAGAGSIMHQLTAFGGKQDPLFRKAIIQSAAFGTYTWDRTGHNTDVFKQLEAAADCSGKGLECLRSKDFATIHKAQSKVVDDAPGGTFGFGPSPDGAWVRQLPQLELLTGNYWKNMTAIISSHTTTEAEMFVTRGEAKESDFVALMTREYGKSDAIEKAVYQLMPLSKYKNQRDRIVQYVQLSTFACNSRYTAQAYKDITYNVQYTGNHGSDMAADFYSPTSITKSFLGTASDSKYQKYIISLVRAGDPNKFKDPQAPGWPKSTIGPKVANTMSVGSTLALIDDSLTAAADCDLWPNVYSAATNTGGFAPPGGVFESNIGEKIPSAKASVHYSTS
ncbi:alpha/beta-hydrolase [Microthyrium microscopicum]|uniref:Carboxylic ester hydrolase n=1 Tax=Microthyrium microscopicum TaxID=703497 RepID=A0A6A6TZM7_9PEZI|nr:alpha/beta-hydrolase [Microthyrium microscopicum]